MSIIKGKNQILQEKLRSSRNENFPSFLYVTSETESKNDKKIRND